ncbi:MAG: carbohydrate ABC transporter permease [Clostridia bacterium]|nr:carbohydrate ABC transporter permease [Clostridia bacterium]
MRNILSLSKITTRFDSFADDIKQGRRNKGVEKTSQIIGMAAKLVLLIGLSIILLYPVLIMLSISLRPSGDLFDPTVVWVPKVFTLDNYKYVFENINLFKVYGVTGGISVVSSFLQMCTCCLAGYGIARFKFRGSKILFVLMLVSIIVPPQIILIPSYLNFVNFDMFGVGLLGKLFTGKAWTVSLYNNVFIYFLPAALGNGIKGGLFVFIFYTFFKGMTNELAEAGYIDGCNRLTGFLHIMLPNAKAPIITVTLFSVVWYWNDYYYNAIYFQDLPMVSYVLKNADGMLHLGADTGVSDPYARFCQTVALALLLCLPLLIFYIIFQRFFTESIEKIGLVG